MVRRASAKSAPLLDRGRRLPDAVHAGGPQQSTKARPVVAIAFVTRSSSPFGGYMQRKYFDWTAYATMVNLGGLAIRERIWGSGGG